MTKLNYVKMDENFRGMTLSNWLGEWVQWLHGATVDYGRQPGEVLHTRGGLSYAYAGGVIGAPRIQAITQNIESVEITDKVPVYINILTSFYFIGENHPRGNLATLTEVMTACMDDFQRSAVVTATIQEKNDSSATPLTQNLVQSNDITVYVHPDSLLAQSFEMPVEKGSILKGCAISFMCLIKSLPAGEYKVITSNVGVRGYRSDSEYTIKVQSQLLGNIR